MKLTVVLACLVCLYCCKDANPAGGEELGVRQVVEDIIRADNRSDIGTVLSLYAKDAVLMPPGKPEIAGIEKIESHYKNIFDQSILQLKTEVGNVIVQSGFAIAWGRNSGNIILKRDSLIRKVDSKYVMMLRKNEQADWKIQRLIWNDN